MTTLTKYDWLNDPTGVSTPPPEGSVSPTGYVPGARTVQGGLPTPKYGEPTTTDWLNWVKSKIPNATAADAGRQLTMTADRSAIPLIYGEDRIGAMVLNVVPYDFGTGPYVIVQCLWAHAVDAMPEEPTYNDKPLTDVGVYYHTFYNGYGASSVWGIFATAFHAASGGVTYTDTLAGFAVSYIAIPVSKFTGSLKFEAVLRGRRVYDPRTATTVWSDNPSLCDADFLVNFCGKTVVWSSVTTAANANDELVVSEKRRTLNVTFKGRENAQAVSETLRAYSATFHVPDAAGIKLVPDRPGSSVATYLHASGQIASVRVSKKDSGQFPTESEVVYTNRTVMPWKDDSVFVAVAGVGTTVPRRLTTVSLPGINRYSQARREAFERLNRMRTSDLSVTLDVFDIGIKHEEGDIITANHPLWNINKLFRIGDPEALPNGMWRLPCIEYSLSGYSDDSSVGPTYPDTGFTNPTVPPATPSGLTHAFGANGIELSWNANPELSVTEYELRKGASWAAGTPLIGSLPTIVGGTTFVWPAQSAASYTIWIKAITGIGTYSDTAASHAFTLSAPVMASLSSEIEGGNYVLSWVLSWSNLPIRFYRVKKAGVEIAQISSDHYTAPIDWAGDKTFTVSAVDEAGNESSDASTTLTINGPGAVASFVSSVVQNTVLFNWTPPTVKPLPIAYYEMRRGSTSATWETATNIGNKAGDQTFTTFFEASAGEYKYFIRPVDTAGIAGASTSITQRVSGVSNFQVLHEWMSVAGAGTHTKVNAIIWDGKVLLPVNDTETFTQHFTTYSRTTPQQQIDAGLPLYIEPTISSGSYEEVFDYGATLTTAMATFSWDVLSTGTPTFTPHLEKSLNGTDWTAIGDVSQSVISNFRYIKAKITVGSTGGDDLVTLNSISLRLDVQTEADGGSKLSTDFAGGYCTVNFNKEFIDVSAITVTPKGTSATKVIAVVEFNDVPNPTSFNVYIYNLSGTSTPTDFGWTAVGVI